MPRLLTALVLFALTAAPALAADPIKVLIIDGQNNHNWKLTTPLLKQWLDDAKLFAVDVATAPPKDTAGFRPKFGDYQVVVSNYNGAPWPAETQKDFTEFVRNGGGFVSVHAADNAFPNWPEYNQMIGLGGWGGRNEKSGPYVRVKDGKAVEDASPGTGGGHGKQHEFTVFTVNADHPITKGLPARWKHTPDELYDKLRGPAKNMTVLAAAFSDKGTGGTGENEPMLFTIDFGKGRVFHTTLGHDDKGMKCVGFGTTLQRGTEWAATGKVTQPVPKDFPTADQTSIRP